VALPGKSHTILSWASSGITSDVIFIGDYNQIGLSLSTAAASVVSIQVNNQDGFQTALTAGGWSTATVLSTSGPYNLEPGHRWLRALQAASTSSATLIVSGGYSR